MTYKVVYANTDGSSRGNPGPGGWAYHLSYIDEQGNHHEAENSAQIKEPVTNQMMELTAVIEAVKAIKVMPGICVVLRSDSNYVVSGLNSWVQYWESNNWNKKKGGQVSNKDLWITLMDEIRRHNFASFTAEYVKGHNGDPDNERVDKLARGI